MYSTHWRNIYILGKYKYAFCLLWFNLYSTYWRYYYKFIINGQWRHSTSSPAERDERGNLNNVIVIGDIASVRPSVQQQKKVCTLCLVTFCIYELEVYVISFVCCTFKYQRFIICCGNLSCSILCRVAISFDGEALCIMTQFTV